MAYKFKLTRQDILDAEARANVYKKPPPPKNRPLLYNGRCPPLKIFTY